MKKVLCVLALLLTAATVGCIAVGRELMEQSDKVWIKEETLYGNASHADGIEFTFNANYARRLFWTTNFNSSEKAKTEYKYYSMQQNEPLDYDDTPLSMGVHSAYGYDNDINVGLSGVFKALYSSLSPGQNISKEFALTDIYEYYPIDVFIGLKNAYYSWHSDMLYSTEEDVVSRYRPFIVRFNEFFKIPVMPDERVTVSVGKGSSGNSVSMGGGHSGSDVFYMMTNSVLGDDAIYFVFDAHTQNGKVVDTSRMPQGFGIYRLPVSYDGRKTAIHLDKLQTVFSLDPQIHILDFKLSIDKTLIYLIANENGMCKLTVIDAKSFEAIQKIDMGETSADEHWYSSYFKEDFAVISLGWDKLSVYKILPNGRFEYSFTVSRSEETEEVYYLADWRINIAFDGERLVMATADAYRRCALKASVYTKEGLVYQGAYRSSLDVRSPISTGGITTFRRNYLDISFK